MDEWVVRTSHLSPHLVLQCSNTISNVRWWCSGSLLPTICPTCRTGSADPCIRSSFLLTEFLFQKRPNVHGIFHFSGKQKFTKFQLAVLIATLFQIPVDHIQRDQGQVGSAGSVQRPDNAALDSSKLTRELGIDIEQANFSNTIRRCVEAFLWIRTHTYLSFSFIHHKRYFSNVFAVNSKQSFVPAQVRALVNLWAILEHHPRW